MNITKQVLKKLAPVMRQHRSYVTETNGFVFRQLFDSDTFTYTYLIGDRKSGECALVDPVLEMVRRDLKLVDQFKLKLKYSINTHVHADHITGSGLIKKILSEQKDVPVPQSVISKLSGGKCELAVEHKDTLNLGDLQIECRSTPGHTFGCMTFVMHEKKIAFTGDALLIRGCGRTDFQQGSSETLYNSVHNEILSLPSDFKLFPGHDYTGQTMTTVKEEIAHNARLNKNIQDFTLLMDNLKLPPPSRLDVSLPANMLDGGV